MSKKLNVVIGGTYAFREYSPDVTEGSLQAGDVLTVGSKNDDGTFNVVRNSDQTEDTLFETEMMALSPETVVELQTPEASKPKKGKGKTKAEGEAPVKVKTSTKSKAPKAELAEEPEATEEEELIPAAPTTTETTEDNPEVPMVLTGDYAPSVLRAVHDAHGDAVDASIHLLSTTEKTLFTLGGVLSMIKRGDLQVARGFEPGLPGFAEFVRVTLGMETRKAHYYVRLYEVLSQFTTEDKIAAIGWTKLRALLPAEAILSTENIDEWLDYARDHSTDELSEKVKTEMINSGTPTHGNTGPAIQRTTFKLVVHQDQANLIREAIDAAKQAMGDEERDERGQISDSAAIVHIVGEWLQLSTGTEGDTEE